jgi:hypothetical protein
MIIKHAPRSKTPETDTDKLADIPAMILEKSEELRELCCKNKRPVLILCNPNGIGGTNDIKSFWNFARISTPEEVIEQGLAVREDFHNMLTNVHTFVMNLTEGKFGVYSTQHEDDAL